MHTVQMIDIAFRLAPSCDVLPPLAGLVALRSRLVLDLAPLPPPMAAGRGAGRRTHRPTASRKRKRCEGGREDVAGRNREWDDRNPETYASGGERAANSNQAQRVQRHGVHTDSGCWVGWASGVVMGGGLTLALLGGGGVARLADGFEKELCLSLHMQKIQLGE